MRNKFNRTFSCFAASALALCAVGCMEEKEIPGVDPEKGDGLVVTFTVGGSRMETKSTASGVKPKLQEVIPVEEEAGIFLEESVIGLDDALYGEVISTKGIPIYTENFGTRYPDFGGIAYQYASGPAATTTEAQPASGLTPFGGKAAFGKINSRPLRYAYDYGDLSWPTGNDLLFFISAPAQGMNGGVAGVIENSLSYQYVSQKRKNENVDAYSGVISFQYESPESAEDQKDILFTSKSLSEKTGTGEAGILFYHTLAGVKFKAGNAGDDVTVINKVTLKNVKYKGSCTVSPTYDAEGYVWEGESNYSDQVTRSAGVSIWDVANDKRDFCLEANGGIYSASDANNFHESFFGEKDEDGEYVNGNLGEDNIMTDNSFKDTFFFVPQETGTIKVVIEYTVSGTAHKKTLSMPAGEWVVGNLYTYTLTTKDISVDVTDELGPDSGDKTYKTDPTVTNTGNAPAYIRAAIVANWYNDYNQIIGQTWDMEDYTGFTGFDKENWQRSKVDGFYYYRYAVEGGAETANKMFTQYDVPDNTGTPAGAHLVMTISAQAIDMEKITSVGANAEANPYGWDATLLTDAIE